MYPSPQPTYMPDAPQDRVKGVGGSEVKFCFQFYLIDSENLEYVGSGTFYRIEKACSVAEM